MKKMHRSGNALVAAITILWILAAGNAPTAGQSLSNAATSGPSNLYIAEQQIVFNILDRIEYEPAAGRIVLMGHFDPAYPAIAIPYYQHLSTLLQYPAPEFSLEWTAESDRRVAELFRRMDSDVEMKKIVSEWGRWVDEKGKVTPTGRFFLPIFLMRGCSQISAETKKQVDKLRESGGAAANRLADLIRDTAERVPCSYDWDAMDRYQIIAKILWATGDMVAPRIVEHTGEIIKAYKSGNNVARQKAIEELYFATNTVELAYKMRDQMVARRISRDQAYTQLNRAICRAFDEAFVLSGQPVGRAFEAALQRSRNPESALTSCFAEMDRHMPGVLRNAFEKIKPTGEIQVPLELVNPSLRGTVMAEPKYYGVDGRTLLGKVMFEADYLVKRLINMPELASRIPDYQTEFTYQRSHPGAPKPSGSVSDYHLWISVDRVDVTQAPDGNVLAFKDAHMRFNIRERGKDGRDLPVRSGSYEALLTRLYDSFSREFPALHEAREAAKMAYAARWLKTRAPSFALPSSGRQSWDVPQRVPGAMFVAWSPKQPVSGGAAVAVSAMGGFSFQLPPVPDVGPSGPVAVDPNLIRMSVSRSIAPAFSAIEDTLPISARLVQSPLFSPFSPPSSGRSAIFDLNVAYCLTLESAGLTTGGAAGAAPPTTSLNADELLNSFFDGRRSYSNANCRSLIGQLGAAEGLKIKQAVPAVRRAIQGQITQRRTRQDAVQKSYDEIKKQYQSAGQEVQANTARQRRLDSETKITDRQSGEFVNAYGALLRERGVAVQKVLSLVPKMVDVEQELQRNQIDLEKLKDTEAALETAAGPAATNTTLRVVNRTNDYITVSVDGNYGCNTSSGSTCSIPVTTGSHKLRAVRHDTSAECGPRDFDILEDGYTWTPWPDGPC